MTEDINKNVAESSASTIYTTLDDMENTIKKLSIQLESLRITFNNYKKASGKVNQ